MALDEIDNLVAACRYMRKYDWWWDKEDVRTTTEANYDAAPLLSAGKVMFRLKRKLGVLPPLED